MIGIANRPLKVVGIALFRWAGGHRMFTLTYNTGMALQSGTAGSAHSVCKRLMT
jgi:hypothetical protein